MTTRTWTVEPRPWDDPDGSALRAAQRVELDARYGSTDHEPAVPELRGSGVASVVLQESEAAAVQRGWSTLRLETGTAQPDAQRFYRRAGYREVPLFGSYIGSPLSVCFERRLDA